MSEITIQDVAVIGRNRLYAFAVGRLAGRWVGFASSPDGLFIFPEIRTGPRLGLDDRARAVLLTGAVAEDAGGAYGGVDEWLVPEDQRGRPEDFRCARCELVGCAGDCVVELADDEDAKP